MSPRSTKATAVKKVEPDYQVRSATGVTVEVRANNKVLFLNTGYDISIEDDGAGVTVRITTQPTLDNYEERVVNTPEEHKFDPNKSQAKAEREAAPPDPRDGEEILQVVHDGSRKPREDDDED